MELLVELGDREVWDEHKEGRELLEEVSQPSQQ